MAVNFQQVNNSKTYNKRLALIKATKIDLTNGNHDEIGDEGIEYSPAYITTLSSCAVNSTMTPQEIHFQLFSMSNIYLLMFMVNNLK